MAKTLYLWDLAGTLFNEEWDSVKTGYPTYEAWVEAQTGKKITEVSDRQYEEMFEIPYREGWYFKLALKPGVKEVLTWAKNNETFTTGVSEQINWRAEYLVPKTGFDFRFYFQKINTTFDYSETNKKTKEMLLDYLEEKYQQGYKTVVYTDDKLANCQMFLEAVKLVQQQFSDFSFRLYHILNDNSGIKLERNYWKIGSLDDFLTNEKK